MSLATKQPLFLVLQQDFDALPDPRKERTRLHRLSDILLLSLAAFCCGAEGYEDIQHWAITYTPEDLRRDFGLRLDNGIPHHDTFRRLLTRLEPDSLEKNLHTLRQRLPNRTPNTQKDPGEAQKAEGIPTKHVALDGKVLRGSFDSLQHNDALILLSAFATDLNLVLGQKKVDVKTNEIPVARDVLQSLAITGATVTADALHCQKETAQAIRERRADYLLAVKDNQEKLHDALQHLFATNQREKRLPMTFHQTVDKDHGRLEVRQGFLIRVSDWLPANDPLFTDWQDLTSVVCIQSERRWSHRGQEKHNQFARYFISSSRASVVAMMDFARSHWKIENNLHWIMDVTFGEDGSRVRTGQGVVNLATFRRMASFLLSQCCAEELLGIKPGGKVSLRKRKKIAGWNPAYLLKVLTI